ncbi:cyclopropane-fatty-acyl-phospholipid synthase family protein [Geodermatophilus sp. DSM 44513]|uniref:SAM-dependent methyltransferase n=1 Tax=Geodermatophilus sp. DSM 44513 TaxID=1528104 RepID=UPI001271C953|nr:class I SAM-dependent methyltransferase [Geodermatophilus sp. DSM 44513]WNV76232.1 class I SAM-dependent methyltransferase [Geodermatophilus sp. DSM 44513]
MDRSLISAVAHRWHPVAAPVSDDSLRRLLTRLVPPGAREALDLGCGSGAWLLRLLEAATGCTGVGVDTSAPALDAARAEARRRGLTDRVAFVHGDAAAHTGEPVDVVLCVGATHAFGGFAGTLTAVRRHLRPGGRVLLGDAFWEHGPGPAALAALGAVPGELPDLAGLLAEVDEAGFEPGYGHLSTAAEWDEYEWCWTGAFTEWALTEAPADDRAAALELARTHRSQWLAGYRGQLGFLTAVLHDVR